MAERVGPTQIQNRNFLAPVGFKFNLQRSPGVAYFYNQANIPDISLGVATQPNYLRDIPTPGDLCRLNLKPTGAKKFLFCICVGPLVSAISSYRSPYVFSVIPSFHFLNEYGGH